MNEKNNYDKLDQIKRESVLLAGPIKIAAYRVRDPDTQEWSSRQFHFTYDNHVVAVMDETSARLFSGFVTRAAGDQRPCATDIFLLELFDKVEDTHDRQAAIKEWLEGDWDKACEGLDKTKLKGGLY